MPQNPCKAQNPAAEMLCGGVRLCAETAEKPDSKRFSGIEKAHRNSIKITVDLWCGRQDLNLHASRHMSLNHTCLPIPPRPHMNSRRIPSTVIYSIRSLAENQVERKTYTEVTSPKSRMSTNSITGAYTSTYCTTARRRRQGAGSLSVQMFCRFVKHIGQQTH